MGLFAKRLAEDSQTFVVDARIFITNPVAINTNSLPTTSQ